MGKPRMPKPIREIEDPVMDKFLDDLLNGRIQVVPEFADLPAWWRAAPAQEADRKHPRQSTQMEILNRRIMLAEKIPEAAEGLRRLIRDLTENGEPLPPLLSAWAVYRSGWGDPPSRSGPRVKVDSKMVIMLGYSFLRDHQYTRREAIYHVAKRTNYDEETIAKIVKTFGKGLRFPIITEADYLP